MPARTAAADLRIRSGFVVGSIARENLDGFPRSAPTVAIRRYPPNLENTGRLDGERPLVPGIEHGNARPLVAGVSSRRRQWSSNFSPVVRRYRSNPGPQVSLVQARHGCPPCLMLRPSAVEQTYSERPRWQ